MARGRGGSYDPGVVTITRRRQLSLEPDIDFRDSRNAQRISDFALEDADILSSRSRNKDRELLQNISNRLGSNQYVDTLPLTRTSTTTRRVYEAPRRLPESALFIRAGSLPPPSRPRIEIYDEDLPPPPPPRRVAPVKTHVVTQTRPIYRAASEPPYSGPRPFYRAPSEPLLYTGLGYRSLSRAPSEPPVYTTYRSTYREPSEYLYSGYRPMYREPSEYLFTGYRPTYRDPTIPLYGYRPLYRAPSEPPYSRYESFYQVPTEPLYRPIYRANQPPYASRYTRMTPSSQEAVNNAKRYMDKIERELGMQNGPIIAEPVVIHHVPSPRVGRRPVATARVTSVGSAAPRYRSSSLPPSSRGAPKSSRIAAIEARLESEVGNYPTAQPESLTSLRSRATKIKDKMDAHKSMMDRYLPIYLGPENDVVTEVDYKYGELVNRMPVLDRHRPYQGSSVPSASPVAPYRVASTYNKPPSGSQGPIPRASFRPKVSETRKRIREVMCATKKDPHYYD